MLYIKRLVTIIFSIATLFVLGVTACHADLSDGLGYYSLSDCKSSPEGVSVVDAANDLTKAPVVFSSNKYTFTLNFPVYCNLVDIYFAVANPENKLIFVDSNGKLTLELLPYAAGAKSAVKTSFSVADSALAAKIGGKCLIYWLVAPANGGELLKSVESGKYELGFYQIDVINPTNSLVAMTFVEIKPGTFIMGSPKDGNRHQVTLTEGYCIQTTEVTQGQWRKVMGINPSYFKGCGDNCPVEGVSWDDAQAFIAKLNAQGGGTYSLPTEEQWEYAARAGSTTDFANGNITEADGYCVDPNLDAMGWYCGNSSNATHPVAQKSPNAWGLYDMHGNVWEWCQDVCCSNRVVRGGGWDNFDQHCRSTHRLWYDPSNRYDNLGFRLVSSSCQK